MVWNRESRKDISGYTLRGLRERAEGIGYDVMAVGTNETNTYRRTERGNTADE